MRQPDESTAASARTPSHLISKLYSDASNGVAGIASMGNSFGSITPSSSFAYAAPVPWSGVWLRFAPVSTRFVARLPPAAESPAPAPSWRRAGLLAWLQSTPSTPEPPGRDTNPTRPSRWLRQSTSPPGAFPRWPRPARALSPPHKIGPARDSARPGQPARQWPAGPEPPGDARLTPFAPTPNAGAARVRPAAPHTPARPRGRRASDTTSAPHRAPDPAVSP